LEEKQNENLTKSQRMSQNCIQRKKKRLIYDTHYNVNYILEN